MKNFLRYGIPLIIFAFLASILWRGLSLDPRQLPSALLNKPAPLFSLPDLKNPQLRFNNQDLLGHVSLINVWASWCLTCREEHAVLMNIAKSHRVIIYGINYKDQHDAATSWLNQLGNPYQSIGFDISGRAGMDWGVYGTPETYIIDTHGIIRYKQIGPITEQIWQVRLLPIIEQLEHEKL